MPNQKHTGIAACPQTTEELLDAARYELARGLARMAKRKNASPRNLELVQRALFHRDVIALKRGELDLRRQRLDQDQRQFEAEYGIGRRRRLVAIQIPEPAHPAFAVQPSPVNLP